MKQYECLTKSFLMNKTYTIIRLDGKAFHTFTRGKFERPFDAGFINVIDKTAHSLCKEVQNTKFAFVQSDEISLVLTDWERIETQQWFDGNIQKMCSVSASLATGFFNKHLHNELFYENFDDERPAFFDSRVFQVPNKMEALNYLIWRQKDCSRNYINAVAQETFGKKDILGMNQKQLIERFEKEEIVMPFPEIKNGRGISTSNRHHHGILKTELCKRFTLDTALPEFSVNNVYLNSIIPNEDSIQKV